MFCTENFSLFQENCSTKPSYCFTISLEKVVIYSIRCPQLAECTNITLVIKTELILDEQTMLKSTCIRLYCPSKPTTQKASIQLHRQGREKCKKGTAVQNQLIQMALKVDYSEDCTKFSPFFFSWT